MCRGGAGPFARFLMARERRALERIGDLDIDAPRCCSPAKACSCAAGSTVCRFKSRSRTATPPISSTLAPHFTNCTAAASCTTISRSNRTGCAGATASAYLIDFQLASRFTRRSKLFRIAAYEDVRHLLKHKRRYAESSLTPTERRILLAKAYRRGSGWRPESRSTTGSRAACSISRTARAADCGSSTMPPRSPPNSGRSRASAKRPWLRSRIAVPAPASMPSSKPSPPCRSAS